MGSWARGPLKSFHCAASFSFSHSLAPSETQHPAPSSDPTVNPLWQTSLSSSRLCGREPSPKSCLPTVAPTAGLQGKIPPETCLAPPQPGAHNPDSMGSPGPSCLTPEGHTGTRPTIRCLLAAVPRARVDPPRSPESPASLNPTGCGPVTSLVWESPGQGPFLTLLGWEAPQNTMRAQDKSDE